MHKEETDGNELPNPHANEMKTTFGEGANRVQHHEKGYNQYFYKMNPKFINKSRNQKTNKSWPKITLQRVARSNKEGTDFSSPVACPLR